MDDSGKRFLNIHHWWWVGRGGKKKITHLPVQMILFQWENQFHICPGTFHHFLWCSHDFHHHIHHYITCVLFCVNYLLLVYLALFVSSLHNIPKIKIIQRTFRKIVTKKKKKKKVILTSMLTQLFCMKMKLLK